MSKFKTDAELAAMQGGPPVSRRGILEVLRVRFVAAALVSFAQAATIVGIVAIMSRYRPGVTPLASDGPAVGAFAWAHSPGLAVAYAAYLQWSFISMNSMAALLLGEASGLFTALALILQLVSGGVFVSEELCNRFFLIGRGLPFYYGVRMFRSILFGGQENWFPMNWGVPTAWNLGCATLAVALHVARLRRRVLVDKLPIDALVRLPNLTVLN